jgi:hypothetical protein
MPKDVDKIVGNELKHYHCENEEDIQGHYYFEGELFLPKTYLKKELKLTNEQREKIIKWYRLKTMVQLTGFCRNTANGTYLFRYIIAFDSIWNNHSLQEKIKTENLRNE